MKTFRLITLQILMKEKDHITPLTVPIREGLIIDREEKDGSWLIEAIIPKDQQVFFDEKKEKEETIILQVIITHRNNKPALMTGQIRKTTELSGKVSVMIDAKMAAGKDDVYNHLLEELIKDGYSGESLLQEFSNLQSNPAAWSKKIAENIYENLKNSGTTKS